MLTPTNFVVMDASEPEEQQWDTLALLIHERESKLALMHLLFAAQLQGKHGPLWLSSDGVVIAVFN